MPLKSIFSPRIEKANLLFPILFVPFVAWELLTHKIFNFYQTSFSTYAVRIIFLNQIHVYFTFAMLLFFPEIRQWTKNSITKKSNNFWIKTSVFFIFIYGAITLFIYTKPYMVIQNLILYFFIIYGHHHSLWQSYGLSRMYNAKDDKRRFEIFEKRIIHFIFAVQSLRLFNRFFPKLFGSNQLIQFIDMSLLIFSLIALITLIVACHRDHKLEQSNKIYFLSRYIFFILVPDAFIAALAIAAIHGVEYFFVFLKMSQNSKQVEATKKIMWIFIGFISFIALVGTSFRNNSPVLPILLKMRLSEAPIFFLVLADLTKAFSLLHYYLDGLLFQFKNEKTRQLVLPLLANKESLAPNKVALPQARPPISIQIENAI